MQTILVDDVEKTLFYHLLQITATKDETVAAVITFTLWHLTSQSVTPSGLPYLIL